MHHAFKATGNMNSHTTRFGSIGSPIRMEDAFIDSEERINYITVSKEGVVRFFRKGTKHRDDGPAVVYPKSRQWLWYKNGICHRDDGPAVKYMDGEFRWYDSGVMHRLDGPALENHKLRHYVWYHHGKKYEPSAHEVISWKIKNNIK